MLRKTREGEEEERLPEDKLKIVPVYDSTHDCMIQICEAAKEKTAAHTSSSSDDASELRESGAETAKMVHSSNERVAKSAEEAQSTMASRWATPTAEPKRSTMKYLADGKTKEWFLKREDLFNGEATVDNAARTLFKTKSTRTNDKKGKASGAKDNEKKGTQGWATSHLDVGYKKPTPNPVRLTGANVLAGCGDNGWGERGGPPPQGQMQSQVPRWIDHPAAFGVKQLSMHENQRATDLSSLLETLPIHQMRLTSPSSQDLNQIDQVLLLETIASLQQHHGHLHSGAEYLDFGFEGLRKGSTLSQ